MANGWGLSHCYLLFCGGVFGGGLGPTASNLNLLVLNYRSGSGLTGKHCVVAVIGFSGSDGWYIRAGLGTVLRGHTI